MKPGYMKDRMQLGSGQEVLINQEHLEQHPDVRPHLEGALTRIHLSGQPRFFRTEVQFNHVIGLTSIAIIGPGDDVVYARRFGRDHISKFVRGRQGEDCSTLTVVLLKTGHQYRLLTAYIGYIAEREPGDRTLRTPEEIETAQKFWANRALLWDVQLVDQSTVVSGPLEVFGPSAHEVEPGPIEYEYEGTTQHGFPQLYYVNASGEHAICCNCKRDMIPNAGHGMACDSCQHEWDKEMSHDYDMGEL